MANTKPLRYTKAFTMKVDEEFLAVLDAIREERRPERTRSDMLRELVFDAQIRRSRSQKKEAK